MTVPSTEPIEKLVYNGPGDYPFTFLAFDEADLELNITDPAGLAIPLVLQTDYTVTIDPDIVGGTCHITYPTSGGSLDIRRTMVLEQDVDYVNNSAFDMEILERSLDELVMMVQQLDTDISVGAATSGWRGDWLVTTAYANRDVVVAPSTSLYVCVIPHTSTSSFTADLASGYWQLVADLEGAADDAAAAAISAAEAAISAAEALASETLAAVSQADAAVHEANSAINAQDAANCAQDSYDSSVSSASEASDSAASAVVSNNFSDYPVNQQVPGYPGEYSAYHWAQQAAIVTGEVVPRDASSGAAYLPSGTTAERPASPTIGMLRYNTTLGYLEYWDGASWFFAANQYTDNGALLLPTGTDAERVGTTPGLIRYNTDRDEMESMVYMDPLGYSSWLSVHKPEIAGISVFLSPSGSDTTGTGKITSPWYSLDKAIEFINKLRIAPGSTATITLTSGTYSTEQPGVVIDHPDAHRIVITGASSLTTIISNIAAADSVFLTVAPGRALKSLDGITVSEVISGILVEERASIVSVTDADFTAPVGDNVVEVKPGGNIYLNGVGLNGGLHGVYLDRGATAALIGCVFEGMVSNAISAYNNSYVTSGASDFTDIGGAAFFAKYNSMILDTTSVFNAGVTTQYSPTRSVDNTPVYGNNFSITGPLVT